MLKKKAVEFSINLQQRTIHLNDKDKIKFKVDAHLIDRIIFGLDDIDITLKEKDKIMLLKKIEKFQNHGYM